MNVLVYSGQGASPVCVQHTLETLRSALEPNYAVSTITNKALISEPWMTKTSALVFPGGADLPYVKECKPAIAEIQKFVNKKGGLFIGICAGGYFGTSRCEFALGDPVMEVSGPRDLKFFSGVARGPAFTGFTYDSNDGARVVTLNVDNGTTVKSIYNGGAAFISPESHDNVEVLATYAEEDEMFVDVAGDHEKSRNAAVILCSNGKGKTLLLGPHPEYVPDIMINNASDNPYKEDVIKQLVAANPERLKFIKYILKRAGLKVNDEENNSRLALTPIYLSAEKKDFPILQEFEKNLGQARVDSDSYRLQSNVDDFYFIKGFNNEKLNAVKGNPHEDPATATKVIVLPADDETIVPYSKTPKFNVATYFKNRAPTNTYGSLIMYSEVVTSTSVLLDANKSLLPIIPESSLVFVGTHQLSGRGRGGNTWVSPAGVLASTVSVSLPLSSPVSYKPVSVVFVQYLVALAMAKAIKSYAKGYEHVPIKIKWPNDLYILDPAYYKNHNLNIFEDKPVPLTDIEPSYVKSAGILVNTNFLNNKYNILIGTGINISNEAPSVSVQHWVDIINEELKARGASEGDLLPPVQHEKLLALYLNHMHTLFDSFVNLGAKSVLPEYYKHWLHSDQIITLTSERSIRARISGITDEYGLLMAKELMPGSDDVFTGNLFQLQPDGNSFDIFKGLISKKVSQ